MVRLMSSVASHNNSTDSSSESESEMGSVSSGSNGSSSSSSSSSASPSSKLRRSSTRDGCDALAIERVEREQRLRRLLSQRKIGQRTTIDDGKNVEPFTMRKGSLDGDDGVLLSTFSNALLFARLCSSLRQCEGLSRSKNFDEILAEANPFFYVKFKAPLRDVVPRFPREDSALTHPECAKLDLSGIVVNRRKRERDMAVHMASREEALRDSVTRDTEVLHGTSTSSGIISKSLQSWEQHLSAELKAEGLSLESFRQKRQDSSYLEKQRFLQQSQMAEYQRELQLQEKRREQESKRAIRRGDGNANF